MVVLDSTIVNVALHQIGVDLGAGDGIEWIVTAYLLGGVRRRSRRPAGWPTGSGASGCSSPRWSAFTRRLGRVRGRARTSACSSLFRVLQGLGGGAMMPVGMAMVFELFPREQHGRAIVGVGHVGDGRPGDRADARRVAGHVGQLALDVPHQRPDRRASRSSPALRLLPDIGHRERRPFDAAGLAVRRRRPRRSPCSASPRATPWGWTSPATIAVHRRRAWRRWPCSPATSCAPTTR